MAQGGLGSVTWEHWTKTPPGISGQESGLVFKENTTQQNLKHMRRITLSPLVEERVDGGFGNNLIRK